MIQLTNIPGEVIFLNRDLLPSENMVVCAAIVDDFFDLVTTPEVRHWKLLEEMVQAGHWGCLDHSLPVFKIRAPIFVARQIMRASGAAFNEISGRYKVVEPKFYAPSPCYRDVKRKELGATPEPLPYSLEHQYLRTYTGAWDAYQSLLESGVRKEQARDVLPVATYTEFWMSLRLSDWLHFLNLRTDHHAQEETRFVALLIHGELASKYPKIFEYWTKYAKGPINEWGTIQTA